MDKITLRIKNPTGEISQEISIKLENINSQEFIKEFVEGFRKEEQKNKQGLIIEVLNQ